MQPSATPRPTSALRPAAVLTQAPPATSTPPPTATPLPTATNTATPTPTLTPTATLTPTPNPTPDGQARTACVPILMYHYVSELPADADAIRRDLTVSPQQFEAQLTFLREAGYTGVTLEDVLLHLATGQPLPAKPIVLTFDDGYADAYTNVFPLLKKHGFPGTFALITGFIDEGRPGHLTWEQAAEMQAAGMEIIAHSVNHPDLRTLGASALQAEVQGSREAIEAHLGKPVRFFCYPSGRYDYRTLAVLRAADYWGAVVTAGGAVHSSEAPYELRRVRVHGGDDLDEFQALLDYYIP